MWLPRLTGSATTEAESLLVELSMALKAARLANLLESKDLPGTPVEDPPRPDSAAACRSVLTDRLFVTDAAHGPDPGRVPGRVPSLGGKLLVFKARELSKP
jgi:hypothetical protein